MPDCGSLGGADPPLSEARLDAGTGEPHLQSQPLTHTDVLLEPLDSVFVVNSRSLLAHRRKIDELHTISSLWNTRCGWKYGQKDFVRMTNVSGYKKRPSCFREPKPVAEHRTGTHSIDNTVVESDHSISSDSSLSD
jgi:hypothetical protein